MRVDPQTLHLTVGHLRRAMEFWEWNLPDDTPIVIEQNASKSESYACLVQRLVVDGRAVLHITDSALALSALAISPVRWEEA